MLVRLTVEDGAAVEGDAATGADARAAGSAVVETIGAEVGTLLGNCLIVVTWGTSDAAAGADAGGGMVAVVFELNFASLEAAEGSAAAEGAAGNTGAD